jgi:hypothetical protein
MGFSSLVGLRPNKKLRHYLCHQFVIAHNLCYENHDYLATFRKRKKMKLREKRHDIVTNIYLSMFDAIRKEAPCNAYDVLQIGSMFYKLDR